MGNCEDSLAVGSAYTFSYFGITNQKVKNREKIINGQAEYSSALFIVLLQMLHQRKNGILLSSADTALSLFLILSTLYSKYKFCK